LGECWGGGREVEMLSLESKLRLLGLQRELSAVKCEAFLKELKLDRPGGLGPCDLGETVRGSCGGARRPSVYIVCESCIVRMAA